MARRKIGYSNRITELIEELRTKTLTEAERDRNITRLDFTGVGYGYNLKSKYPKDLKAAVKDTFTPELKHFDKLVASMEI